MPNRYEREIEEILRNLESTEPKPGLGRKFGERMRRKPVHRPKRRSFVFPTFGITTWLLLIAVVAALIAGGYAYAIDTPNLFTGILALISTVCLILLLLSSSVFRSRSSPSSHRAGSITPLRRGPLNSLRTRWNLFLLKMRYRRKRRP